MKSCTIKKRIGNPKPRSKELDMGYIQSMGLPNLGYMEYIKIAKKLKKYNKPIIASVAGFNINEFRTITKAFQKSEVDLIEVNLSCPNIANKSIFGYDFIETEKILEYISNTGTKLIGLKLPVYLEHKQFQQMANLIIKYNITFISCINSIAHALVLNQDTERTIIKPNDGFGGLCGKYIKPFALSNIRTFRKLLNGRVTIFGVGGIENGIDMFEHILAGADAVQVATEFMKTDEECFERINSDFKKVMSSKGYKRPDQIKGNIKRFIP